MCALRYALARSFVYPSLYQHDTREDRGAAAGIAPDRALEAGSAEALAERYGLNAPVGHTTNSGGKNTCPGRSVDTKPSRKQQ